MATQDKEGIYRILSENAYAGIAMVDNHFSFEYVNPAICNILGYTREALTGKDFRDLLTAESKDFVSKRYVDRQAGKHPPSVYTIGILRKDGKKVFAEMQVSLLKTKKGQVKTVIQIFDVTEREALKKELKAHANNLENIVKERTLALEKANRKLEESFQDMESFSYSVSHDLRAPIRAIKGFAGILMEQAKNKLNKEENTYLTTIDESASQMNQMIDDLLRFSRLGREALDIKPINLHQLFHQVIPIIEESYPDHHPKIIMKRLGTIWADKKMAYVVLLNVLDNAFKYTQKTQKPVIEIGSFRKEKEFIFYIKDNGTGFNPAYQDRLFMVFQRLHGKDYPGSGVGLALVKRIISRHEGHIWAESEASGGATFFISFPSP